MNFFVPHLHILGARMNFRLTGSPRAGNTEDASSPRSVDHRGFLSIDTATRASPRDPRSSALALVRLFLLLVEGNATIKRVICFLFAPLPLPHRAPSHTREICYWLCYKGQIWFRKCEDNEIIRWRGCCNKAILFKRT